MSGLKLRPPRNRFDVIRMLGLFDQSAGLDDMLAHFDLARLPAAGVDRIVLGPTGGRPPPTDGLDPGARVRMLLRSDRFRAVALRNVLETFPNKRRLIFVHIPKCAGSDLTELLRRSHLAIEGAIANPDWYAPDELLKYLHDIVLAATFVDDFLVCGHVPLPFYLGNGLIRPDDSIFTVVRDPTALVVSQVNYILTLMSRDPNGRNPGTRRWLDQLAIDGPRPGMSAAERLALGRAVLRDARMVPANTICRSLGTGESVSAMAAIVASDIEITDTTRYEAWLAERWGIPESPRGNQSDPFLTLNTLDADDRAVIATLTAEDRRVYAAIMRRLDTTSATSIRGGSLA